MNLSTHSQKSKLEKPNRVGNACQVACQPSNNSLKNVWIEIHQYT